MFAEEIPGQNCIWLPDTALDCLFFFKNLFYQKQCKYAINIRVAQIWGIFYSFFIEKVPFYISTLTLPSISKIASALTRKLHVLPPLEIPSFSIWSYTNSIKYLVYSVLLLRYLLNFLFMLQAFPWDFNCMCGYSHTEENYCRVSQMGLTSKQL